jgi:succinate dehydrogenase / fumarate reductase iron-sulfur subunit
VTIEPLPGFKVLKDLMVDLTPFFDRVALIRPFLVNRTPPPEKERLQTPADQGKIDEAIRCILCASCVAACPVTHGNPRYIGPAPLVQAFRRVFDSRDEEMRARLKQLAEPDMAEACTNRFECTRVCPKEIKVTKTINTLKREIAKHLGEGKGGRA